MTPLIKILIISDDIEKWLSFFRGCLVVKNKNNITTVNKALDIHTKTLLGCGASLRK